MTLTLVGRKLEVDTKPADNLTLWYGGVKRGYYLAVKPASTDDRRVASADEFAQYQTKQGYYYLLG